MPRHRGCTQGPALLTTCDRGRGQTPLAAPAESSESLYSRVRLDRGQGKGLLQPSGWSRIVSPQLKPEEPGMPATGDTHMGTSGQLISEAPGQASGPALQLSQVGVHQPQPGQGWPQGHFLCGPHYLCLGCCCFVLRKQKSFGRIFPPLLFTCLCVSLFGVAKLNSWNQGLLALVKLFPLPSFLGSLDWHGCPRVPWNPGCVADPMLAPPSI